MKQRWLATIESGRGTHTETVSDVNETAARNKVDGWIRTDYPAGTRIKSMEVIPPETAKDLQGDNLEIIAKAAEDEYEARR